jgi:hypothetical protein
MATQFVYVARLDTGDEVQVRQVLRDVPVDALSDHRIEEFATYVGSGYCLLQICMPDGDFQRQFTDLLNDPRMKAFTERLSALLVEGDQIGQPFGPGTPSMHGGGLRHPEHVVTSAQMPLTAEVARWRSNS